jgi:polyphosphate kinase 2
LSGRDGAWRGFAKWNETAADKPATETTMAKTDPEYAKGDASESAKGKAPKNRRTKAANAAASSKPASSPERLSTKDYERELDRLHVELVKLQRWVVHKGLKVCIVFEGRDGAGKGGTIKAITERVSPRIFRVIALPAPTDREKSQMYAQRYIPHMPAAGEIVVFDRSWYNRAGVESVLGFCSEEQARGFLKVVPLFEHLMIDSGILLLKYWLEVSPEEQTRRLNARIGDGRKTWKLSPMDVKSYDRWDEYTRARDEMFAATDSSWAPWFVARSEDKRRVRLNVISHLLSRVPYKDLPAPKVKLPKRKIGRYKPTEYPFKFIPEPF